MAKNPELSIVMPCLNEEETLAICIEKANAFFETHKVEGEIIISDNGSTDKSIEIAQSLNATVVHAKQKGYGNALKTGIEAANGEFIIMGDADDSYDFSNLMPYLDQLRKGFDLVMGNRFKGGIEDNAMPFLHKYLGNPVLSFIGRLFFKIKIGDFHCGLRGFSKSAYNRMNLKTTGMEFASEMVVKSKLNGLSITEVPTTLKKDGRSRKPHLKTWSDGWRHLRFLMLYAPNWVFLYPGILLVLIGLILGVFLLANPLKFEGITLDVHTLLYASAFLLVGVQFLIFYGLTKVFAVENELLPKSNRYNKLFHIINLERGLILGFVLLLIGLFLSLESLSVWRDQNFGNLDVRSTLRLVIPAITCLQLGIQTILFSFFFSILGLKK
ncbi:glycosyltransferase family 2 protein [Winogradskyella tangerina]|uniref:glycosyltransferase family 2 protein n=1 Tax=Winogradskyella tangerina TaxID=2023240 RepID=UPI001E48FA60|nr:glycosyltransferase family 2 protein [Winogradskyella tangerina]